VVADPRPLTVGRAAALAVVLLATAVAGCGPRSLYYWGHYEALVYEMYADPGDAEPGEQIDELTEDVARAQSNGQLVPPGMHAHLGYMQLLHGNAMAARAEFETEKRLYPESAAFMDRLLAGMDAE
jgi:hypothetical protein